MDVKDKWRQHIVDALEILNVEHHAMRTQLEGVSQAWEAEKLELHSVGAQLGGIHQGIEYLARMVWKRHAVSHGNLASG